jgi:hypothetical protein
MRMSPGQKVQENLDRAKAGPGDAVPRGRLPRESFEGGR